jgi:CheY-like chemotaxis protein
MLKINRLIMKFTILLIDDSDVDNYISNHVLKETNLANEIIVKNSAMDALSYLRTTAQQDREFPDLIFLDINMPRMNGFEFLQEFSALPESRIRNCSVAMLTSSMSPDDKVKAMRCPYVKHFFNKPLNEEILMEVIGVNPNHVG